MSWASGPCYPDPIEPGDQDWTDSDQALCLCHLENDDPLVTEDDCPAHGPAGEPE